MKWLDSFALRICKTLFRALRREYGRASAYYGRGGAQTPSSEYGGPRSYVYEGLVEKATTVRELLAVPRRYRELHAQPEKYNDEWGGIVRIIGYRLRWVPLLGSYLERRIRADDAAMAAARFNYPDEYTYTTPEWESDRDNQQRDNRDH